MIGTKLKNKKTLVKNPLRQNEKNRFSFCRISENNGRKTKKFWKSVFHNNMNPLSKFKKNRLLTRAQDLTDRRGLTQLCVYH
jgi:hypothetical protein